MRRFGSARDASSISLLLAAAVLAVVGALALATGTAAPLLKAGLVLILLAAAVFVLSLLLGTRYDLTETSLEIRHGPLSWSIPLDAIRTVTPVRNLAASAALSRDRLRIRYGDGFAEIYISPADRAGFLRELQVLAPQVAAEDGPSQAEGRA